MYQIISFILTLLVLNSIAFAENKRKIIIEVTSQLKLGTHHQSSEYFDFYFKSNESNLHISNDLIYGKVDAIIVPSAYALQSMWSFGLFTILYKVGVSNTHLLSKNSLINNLKSSYENKKIMLIQNSADEFYIDNYLKGVNFKKIYANTIEIQNAIANNFKILNGSVDVVAIGSTPGMFHSKNKRLRLLKIPGGQNLLILHQNIFQIEEYLFSLKFIKNKGITLEKPSKADFDEITALNNFLKKAIDSQANFNISINIARAGNVL